MTEQDCTCGLRGAEARGILCNVHDANPRRTTEIDYFADAEGRAKLREMITAQVLGRYNGDGGDEPLPHIMAGLLTDIDKRDAEIERLRAERNALLALIDPIDGLLMYEDKAIEDFAARRDPMPHVHTGPRKWLARIRAARANVPKSVTKPWEE